MTDYLNEYYTGYDEDGRLRSRHGQVEFRTTMQYIEKYLFPGAKILEIGAGTGIYSTSLAVRGYHVEAVELIEHNIEIFKNNIVSGTDVTVRQGNALDLSFYGDGAFDIVLLLGPMYHLYTEEDQLRALSEAIRTVRRGGIVFVSYCIMDATILSYAFGKGNIDDLIAKGLLDTEEFVAKSTPEEIFQLYRQENIDYLNSHFQVDRLHYVASDLATGYMRDMVDRMDDDHFELYMKYHFKICERPDMTGATYHSLDILKKR